MPVRVGALLLCVETLDHVQYTLDVALGFTWGHMTRNPLEQQAVVVQLAVAHVIQVSIIAPMRVKPGVRAAPEAKD